MVTKIERRSASILIIDTRFVTIDHRWLSEPALVLFGYLLLGTLIAFTEGSLLQSLLAALLALLGSGYSFVTVLFPRSSALDVVERTALAASLSLAIGGLLGFALARSPWGLRLVPLLVVTMLFNLVCYAIVSYRRRNENVALRVSLEPAREWWGHQLPGNRVVTVVLLGLLLSGLWSFWQVALPIDTDPPMTEFFLLDESGLAEAYPETALPGEQVAVMYGIVNREEDAAVYEIQVLTDGKSVGSSAPIRLSPDEDAGGRIAIRVPQETEGPTKLNFLLYRAGEPYRVLHLWLDVEPITDVVSGRTSTR